VATIEEATAARCRFSAARWSKEQGKLTIEGLPRRRSRRKDRLRISRVFAQVSVRPLLQKVRLERLEVDHPELRLASTGGSGPPSGGQCLPDVLDRFEFGRVKVRKATWKCAPRTGAFPSLAPLSP